MARSIKSNLHRIPCLSWRGIFFSIKPLLFFFLFLSRTAFLFSQDHLTLRKEAEDYYNKGDISNALLTAQSALSIAEVNVGKNNIDYAVILGDAGGYNLDAGNYSSGISQLEEACDLIKKIKGENNKDYNDAFGNLGLGYFYNGEFEKSESILLKSLGLVRKFYGAESKEYVMTLTNLATVQSTGLFKLDESEKYLIEAKKILENQNKTDTPEYASVANGLAGIYQDRKDYFKAESLYKIAAKIHKRLEGEKSQLYVTTIQNLGDLYQDMGRYAEAKLIIEKCVTLQKEVSGEETEDYAVALNNLAVANGSLGNYSEEEKFLLQSIGIKKKIHGADHPSYLQGLSNLAVLYKRLGRSEEALSTMQKVMEAAKGYKISRPEKYAEWASNLGTIYFDAGKNDQAEKLFKEAIEINKEQHGETFGEYTVSLSNLSVVYMQAEEYKQAKELLLKASAIAKTAGQYNSKDNIELLNNLASVYQGEKNLAKAEEIMRDVVKFEKEYNGEKNPAYNFFLFNLGIYVDGQGKWKEAEQIYPRVIDSDFFILDNNFSELSESEKANFYSTVSVHFDVFYRFAIQHAKEDPAILAKALNYRLATKAMLLNSANKIRNTISQSKDTSLVNAYLKWKSEKDYLIKLYSLPKRELAILGVRPDSIERSVNDLEKKLSYKTDLLSKNSKKNITWKDVQNVLKPDEAAVEIIRVYSPFADEIDKVFYIALIIDKNEKDFPRIAVMDDGYEMETKYTREYRDAIFDTTKKENTYVHFWQQIDHELNGIKKIYFSSDGVYSKININSIKNPSTNSFLIDHYDFHFVSTLRDLSEKKGEPNTSKTAVLFGYPDYTFNLTQTKNQTSGSDQITADYLLERNKTNTRSFYLDPLPGTKKEVEGIEKVMKEKGWQIKTFLGGTAQEQTLKAVSSPVILHIATHGYFQNDVDASFSPATSLLTDKMSKNPLLRSGLMMAGASNVYSRNYANISNFAEQEDGILTAYEAMNLNLEKTELVVLSACETGLGEIRNGEGVYGLQRAFMIAGAKTVIMSLWTVSDEATQKLMNLFYSKWLETGDKYNAFRYAQLELKKSFPDPYFWSAFVMIDR